MEKPITKILEDAHTSTHHQIVTPNYDHIELNDEEVQAWTDWALRIARKKKAAAIAEMAYSRKLIQPTYQVKFNYDQLKDYLVKKHNIVDATETDKIQHYIDFREEYFVIDDDNREIFEMLLMYFSNDPSFELSGEYSLKKGILINGPTGCGKTKLMKIFSQNTFRPFITTSARTIADSYQEDGIDALNKFSSLLPVYPQRNFGFDAIGHCFDDLGTEDDKKNYGNQVNVLQDIIYKVYDQELTGWFHMTTNLGGQEIDSIYGTRIRSRMREMYNQIMFSPTAKDRRK
jgi:hypothetical protein